MNSQRVPPSIARASRSDSVHHWSDRDNLHDNIACHGPVGSESADVIPQNLTDQAGTVVLIGVNFACLPDMGDFAVPMIFKSFHAQPDSQGARHDLA